MGILFGSFNFMTEIIFYKIMSFYFGLRRVATEKAELSSP